MNDPKMFEVSLPLKKVSFKLQKKNSNILSTKEKIINKGVSFIIVSLKQYQ